MNTDLSTAIACLRDAHVRSTQGRWVIGQTTHHTIVEGSGYIIAEFHHADDASFVDQAHEFVPVVLDALSAAYREITELRRSIVSLTPTPM